MKNNLLELVMIISKQTLYAIIILCLGQSLLFADEISGQSMHKVYISIDMKKASLPEVFNEIEDKTEFIFTYGNDVKAIKTKLRLSYRKATVAEILKNIAQQTRVEFLQINQTITVKGNQEAIKQIENSFKNEEKLDKIVTGKVTDENGSELPGVNVLVKGTNIGTITNVEGNYSLNVPDDATILVFSYVGYLTEEVDITERTTVDFVLTPDISTLSEIVVLGYGTQEKKDVTGAVSTIQGKILTKAPASNLASALTGKLSGVITNQSTGQPGFDNVQFRIRGVTSYRGGQQPLIIVDGIERSFSRINPNNVESISILKDAAATAVYGRRGANGVVLITTKRGAVGEPSFEYNGRYGWQSQTRKVELMNAGEYARYLNEAKVNIGEVPVFTDQQVADYENGVLPSYDWIDALLDNSALQQQHNLSASGGSDKTKYFVSYGFLDQDGLFATSGFNQHSVRSNLDMKFANRLSVGLDLLGRLENRTTTAEGGLGGIFQGAAFSQPTLNPFPDVPGVPDALGFNGFNGSPIGRAERRGVSERDNNVFQSNIKFTYDIPDVEGLQANALYSNDYTVTRSTSFLTPYDWYQFNEASGEYDRVSSGISDNIVSSESRNEFTRQTLQLSLNYNKTFGNHDIAALVLFEQIENDFNSLNASRRGYISTAIPSLFAGNIENDDNNSFVNESASRGWIGRINYSYRDKYLFQANGRIDKSFAFAEEFRTGFFPSFSAGWRISEEPFLSGSNLVNNLKLRASWGQVGNDNVGQFQYLSTYSFGGGAVIDGAFVGGIRRDGIPNPSITWETVTSTNIGVDAGFLDGKIEVEFDYFWRKTKDILDTPSGVVPASFGAGIAPRPLGEFDSWGLEAVVKHNNTIGEVNFTVEGNLSWYDNEVVKFNEPEDINPAIAQVGRRLDERRGFIADGLFQTQEEINNHATQFGTLAPGDIKYRDINGRDEDGNLTGQPDGKIDGDDRTVIGGSGFTNLIFGLNLNVEYKGFDLQANFQGAGNFTRDIRPSPFERDGNSLREIIDSWRPGNEDAKYPRLTAGDLSANNRQTSSFWITTVNYSRLRNLEIGYNFNNLTDALNEIGIRQLRVFLSGNNLFTLSNLDWRDPEGVSSNLPFYPQVKTVSFGLNVGF